MHSPDALGIDRTRISWLGIFVQPLFLRDGMELKFRQDKTLQLSILRLSAGPEQPHPPLNPGFHSPRKARNRTVLFTDLELQVHSELHLAHWYFSIGDLPRATHVNGRVRQAKVHVVEDLERIGSQFERPTLAWYQVL
jgi:hypothetical protein